MHPRTISGDDYRALAEFRYRLRCFLSFSEVAARAAGIEPQQHQLLLAIRGLPRGARPTIQTLAERLQLRHHTVVGLVDRLQERGLIERRSSRADGREVLIGLRPAGRELLERLSLAHRDELRRHCPDLLRALGNLTTAPTRRATARAAAHG